MQLKITRHTPSLDGAETFGDLHVKTLNVGVTDSEPWEQRTVPTALVVALTVSQTLPPTLSALYILYHYETTQKTPQTTADGGDDVSVT